MNKSKKGKLKYFIILILVFTFVFTDFKSLIIVDGAIANNALRKQEFEIEEIEVNRTIELNCSYLPFSECNSNILFEYKGLQVKLKQIGSMGFDYSTSDLNSSDPEADLNILLMFDSNIVVEDGYISFISLNKFTEDYFKNSHYDDIYNKSAEIAKNLSFNVVFDSGVESNAISSSPSILSFLGTEIFIVGLSVYLFDSSEEFEKAYELDNEMKFDFNLEKVYLYKIPISWIEEIGLKY